MIGLILRTGLIAFTISSGAPAVAAAQERQASVPSAPDLATAFQAAFRSSFALTWNLCISADHRARISAVNVRLSALQPLLNARLGRERLGQLASQVMSDLHNVETPGCYPENAFAQRIANLEQAADQLEAAARSHH